MQTVSINLDLVVSDDVAEYIASAQQNDSLKSELSSYFEQKLSGGYILTQDQLEVILEGMLEDDDNGTILTENDYENINNVITESVKSLLSEMDLTSMVNSSMTSVQVNSNVVEESKQEEEEDVVSASLTLFDTDESAKDIGEMSDDEADDLAALFGF